MTDERPLTDEELDALISSEQNIDFPLGSRPGDCVPGAFEVELFDYEQGYCVFGCGGLARGQSPEGHQPGCLLLRLVADVRRLRGMLCELIHANNGMCIDCGADASIPGEDQVLHRGHCEIAVELGRCREAKP